MTEETMTMTQPDTTGTTGNAPEGNEDIINAAQLMDELGAVANGLISFGDFRKSGLQFVRQDSAAVFAKAAFGVGGVAQVGTVIHKAISPVVKIG